jgi:hypothetical protein
MSRGGDEATSTRKNKKCENEDACRSCRRERSRRIDGRWEMAGVERIKKKHGWGRDRPQGKTYDDSSSEGLRRCFRDVLGGADFSVVGVVVVVVVVVVVGGGGFDLPRWGGARGLGFPVGKSSSSSSESGKA